MTSPRTLRGADSPDLGDGAAFVGRFAPGIFRRDRGGDQRPRVLGAEREDRREVVVGRAGEVEAVFLRARQGALVGQDLAGGEILDADTGENAVSGAGRAVGAGVVLRHRPDRRLGVGDERARLPPLVHRQRGSLVGVVLGLLRPGLTVGFGQVDRDGVVWGAPQQLCPHRGVDHVIRWRGDVLQRPDHVEVVVGRVDRAHVGHRGRNLTVSGVRRIWEHTFVFRWPIRHTSGRKQGSFGRRRS